MAAIGLVASTWWVAAQGGDTNPLGIGGPAASDWILVPSGALSSLGSASVRSAVLAVAVAALVLARRWYHLGYVVAVVLVVRVVERLAKAAVSRARPADVERGYALAPTVRVVVILAILGAGVLILYCSQSRHRLGPLIAGASVAAAYLAMLAFNELMTTIHLDAGQDSYPSGHASNTLAIFAALALLRPRGRRWDIAAALGVAFALAVGVSRVTLGFHHPLDILGGWLLSAAVALGLRAALPASSAPTATLDNRSRAGVPMG